MYLDGNQILYFDTPQQALADADICFIFTEWDEVKALQPADFMHMKHPIILDGRNCFSVEKMKEYPLIYDSIGRDKIDGL